MLRKTHMAVGTAVGLALLQPAAIPELIIGTGTLAVSSVVSDIDSDTSDSHKIANKIIAVSFLGILALAAAQHMLNINIYSHLMGNNKTARLTIGAVGFLIICAFGKEQPHRSFMHSFAALFLLTGCIQLIFPLAAQYFFIGFLTHLAADALNYKGERLFYPLKIAFSLDLCTAKGIVNELLFLIGSAGSIVLFITLFFHI